MGVFVATRVSAGDLAPYPIVFAAAVLLLASLSAYALGIPRFFYYFDERGSRYHDPIEQESEAGESEVGQA